MSLVRQLAVNQHYPTTAAKVCGICTLVEHPTDLCPTLQETESVQTESVGAVGGFQYGKQPYQPRQFDNQPYGNSHSVQAHNKDHMQLNEPDLCQMYPMEQLVTNRRLHNTKHHPSRHSNRELLLKATHHH
ncbi:hypothetical protein CR513_52518, partial [Mucuna pruriens]